MNRKFILTVLSVLVIGNCSCARVQSYDKILTTSEPQATAGAKQRLDKIVDNGFQLRYEIRGKTITASAVGDKLSYLRSSKVKVDARSVMVKAVTDDEALEITTYFTLDEKKQKLVIDRRIRNRSTETVNVQMIGEYIDPKVSFGVQGNDAKSDLVQTAVKRVRAGQLQSDAPEVKNFPDWIKSTEECHCVPPPPPCLTIVCPPGPLYISARVALAGDKLMLQFEHPTSLASQNSVADATSLANEVRFVMEMDVVGT